MKSSDSLTLLDFLTATIMKHKYQAEFNRNNKKQYKNLINCFSHSNLFKFLIINNFNY